MIRKQEEADRKWQEEMMRNDYDNNDGYNNGDDYLPNNGFDEASDNEDDRGKIVPEEKPIPEGRWNIK